MNGLVEMAVVAAQQGEHMEREAMLPPKKRKRQTLCEAAEQSLGGLGGPAHPPIAAAGDCDSEDSREPAPRAGAKGKEARIVAKDGVAAEVEAADLALARALQEAENVRPAEALRLAARPAGVAVAAVPARVACRQRCCSRWPARASRRPDFAPAARCAGAPCTPSQIQAEMRCQGAEATPRASGGGPWRGRGHVFLHGLG